MTWRTPALALVASVGVFAALLHGAALAALAFVFVAFAGLAAQAQGGSVIYDAEQIARVFYRAVGSLPPGIRRGLVERPLWQIAAAFLVLTAYAAIVTIVAALALADAARARHELSQAGPSPAELEVLRGVAVREAAGLEARAQDAEDRASIRESELAQCRLRLDAARAETVERRLEADRLRAACPAPTITDLVDQVRGQDQ